jgi:hypothetical protein
MKDGRRKRKTENKEEISEEQRIKNVIRKVRNVETKDKEQ